MQNGDLLRCRVGNKIVTINASPTWKEDAVRKANATFNEAVATNTVEILENLSKKEKK